ncbi:class I SAM-dependent methyltransferase [Solimonas terrae]|uniref:Class I SAM-dependent methyltransferase n=1 Tax=Solimonas terrae TaxID=1396819 RepID=A0A6M2BSN9_9GAMM|nr:class I SAM-dependent methyltransferase [Solimonas terrae]NGY05133.1 class I SAM-dependent methyltransferase [Solimonas terrae]
MSDAQRQEIPDYGIDAPDVVRRFLMIGTVALVVNFAAPSLVALLPVATAESALGIARSLGWMGWSFVATACVMLWGSKVGKFRLRDKLLAAMPWRGDERVLDIGCGHGLMLAGIAQRLSSGRAIGIDIWRNEDQSRNSPEATLRNMRLEGVGERVEVRTADARELPFDAASFDVVVSSWALHNMASREDRRRALAEIVRVLRPGGRVCLVDIRHGPEYAAFLRDAGLPAVQLSAPNFLFVMPTRTVTASKAG